MNYDDIYNNNIDVNDVILNEIIIDDNEDFYNENVNINEKHENLFDEIRNHEEMNENCDESNECILFICILTSAGIGLICYIVVNSF